MKSNAKVSKQRKPSKKYKANLNIFIKNNSYSKDNFEETKEKSLSRQDYMNIDIKKF